MKTLKLIPLLFVFMVIQKTDAQVSLNVSFNIGSQPAWGPVGYDYVEFYYLPDIEAYYWVPSRQFVYISNGRWVFTNYLPARHRGYNLYTGYKVVINEPKAWKQYHNHRVRYVSYKSKHGQQVVIRNSKDPKYYIVKGHPNYKSPPGNPGKGNKKGKQ